MEGYVKLIGGNGAAYFHPQLDTLIILSQKKLSTGRYRFAVNSLLTKAAFYYVENLVLQGFEWQQWGIAAQFWNFALLFGNKNHPHFKRWVLEVSIVELFVSLKQLKMDYKIKAEAKPDKEIVVKMNQWIDDMRKNFAVHNMSVPEAVICLRFDRNNAVLF
jgi:hypothetical protein